jgi:hypothetical protein
MRPATHLASPRPTSPRTTTVTCHLINGLNGYPGMSLGDLGGKRGKRHRAGMTFPRFGHWQLVRNQPARRHSPLPRCCGSVPGRCRVERSSRQIAGIPRARSRGASRRGPAEPARLTHDHAERAGLRGECVSWSSGRRSQRCRSGSTSSSRSAGLRCLSGCFARPLTPATEPAPRHGPSPRSM